MRAAFCHCLVALTCVSITQGARAQAQPPSVEPSARTPSPELIAPKLLEKVDPEYPAQALAEEQSGEVILQLELDETGRVTSARVTKSAGFGMDESAQQAALKLVFAPATRAGKPVPARISYKMDFTLRRAVPIAPDEPQAATPQLATLRGIVRLEDSDVPCAGAVVALRGASGRVERVTTDSAGAFEFSQVMPGESRLEIELPGYDAVHSEERLEAGETLELKFRMHAHTEGLEVTIQGEREEREVTRRSVERKELAVMPGTGGDALKVIESMPGVGRTPAFSGMIVVRGSSPYGTQTFVDGAFVPMIYHFGGLSSIVPTEMIESIDFYPGNFSAKYGRATGGVIDVKTRTIDDDGQYHGMAQIDLIDARFVLRGPVPLAKGWSFNLGARRSHVDAWIGAVMSKDAGFSTAPVYYDWQAFAETKPTPSSVFRVGVFGSDDRLAMVLKNAIGTDPSIGRNFEAAARTARLQATYRNQVSARLSVNAMASVGLDRELSQMGAISSVDINYVPIIMRGDLSYRVSDSLLVRVGPDVIVYRYDADVLSLAPPEPGQMEESHSNRPLLRLNRQGYLSGPAGFAELEWSPLSRLKVVAGGRIDYFNLNERWDVSPRLNARYDLHTGPQRTTLKGGVGVFMEPPQIIQVISPFGTPSLRSNRSVHSSVGIEQVISNQVEVSIEAFHKYLGNLVVPARFDDGGNGYSNAGKGSVYGTETMVRWKPGGRFFGWIAYTLSRSVRQNEPAEPSRVFDFDQTHNLAMVGSYDVGRGWRLGGKFRLVSGNPYTPCQGGVLNAAAGSYECVSGEPNSRRIPPFHQLDLRVDKTWDLGLLQLTSYLDVQNVYFRANPEGVSYNYRYTAPTWSTGLPFIPSLGLKGEF